MHVAPEVAVDGADTSNLVDNVGNGHAMDTDCNRKRAASTNSPFPHLSAVELSESTRIRSGCLSDVLVEFRPIRVFGIHFVPILSKDNGQVHARSLKTQPRGDRDCRAPRGRFFFGAGQNPHSEAKSI